MIKKLPVKILTIIMTLTVIMSPFLVSVKADTYTIDDLYNRLTNIYQALNGPNTSRPNTTIMKLDELKRDIEYLFGSYGDGAGDGHISYTYNNQVYTNQPFHYALGDMITQENEILMSIVSSYVDASDPNNPVIKPGLFAKVDNLAALISSGNGTDVQIEADLDGILSDLNSIKSYLNTIIELNERSFYDLESFSAYHLFSKMGWDGTFDVTNFNYPALDITTTPATNYSGSYNANKRFSVKAGDTVIVSFYSNAYLLQATNGVSLNSGNNRSIYWHSMSGTTDIDAKLIDYNTERVTNQGYLYHLLFTNNTNSTQFISFDILYNGPITIYIIPFYVGSTRFLSDRMQSIIQYDPDILLKDLQNSNNTWFERIFNQLTGNPDPDNKYQDNKDDLNQSIDDYIAVESTFNTDFSTNMVDVKTEINKTSNMLQSLGYASQFISGIIQRFYSIGAQQGLSIIFLLPLILGVALFFIGRGGIALRQGPATDEYMTIDEEPTIVNGTKYQMHRVYHRSRHHNRKG